MDLIDKTRYVAVAALLLVAASPGAQDTDEDLRPAPTADQVVPVAEEEPTTEAPGVPELSEVPEVSDEALLVSQFQRYKELMNDGVLDEADSVAKSVIELAIRITGPRSNDTARALTNLAIVQHRREQYDAAQQNFEQAVEIIEDNEDRLNGQLINPLRGLGASQLEGGRPDLALATFQRAVHVTHVNQGPHNIEQVQILESLAEASLRLGAADDAKKIQDSIYTLNARRFADNALNLVPSLMRRAAWQHRAGFIYDERATYRRIVRIIETQVGKDSLELVAPLIRLGQSYFYADLSGTQNYQTATMTTGEIYFKRAVRIAEENPDADWRIKANATLSLGDYYMFQGSEQRARKVYKEVWTLLSVDEERFATRQEELEELVALRERPIPQYVNPGENGSALSSEPLLQGKITVSYVISSQGRATNLKIVEAQPVEFEDMLRNVQREMRRRIYRPQFDDSGPVNSPEQILTHQFYFRQEDLDAIRVNEEDDAAAEQG